MVFTQARRSRPGERAISLRRIIFAWARLKIENNPDSRRILTQTELSRLYESVSPSSETGPPRWDLAQWQGWVSGVFAQPRATRLGENTRFPICSYMQQPRTWHKFIHTLNLHNPSINSHPIMLSELLEMISIQN